MKSCRTRKLCQTADCLFHFSGCNHHQVCKFVYDDYNLWKFLCFIRIINIFNVLDFIVVTFQITDIILGKKLI